MFPERNALQDLENTVATEIPSVGRGMRQYTWEIKEGLKQYYGLPWWGSG